MRDAVALEGLIPLDKPEGPTSHDMVARARRALGVRRIGHTGTLDPFASGLLLLCVGRATRLAEYLGAFPKDYIARVRLGVRTTTDDREGDVLARTEVGPELTEARVLEAVASFEGELAQVPPVFSAKKVAGDAAHRRARRGETLVLDPVRVTVHRIAVEAIQLPYVSFRVSCSTGTYVRAIGRDLGERLGIGGHLTELRRLAIGPFRVESALSPEELEDPEARRSAWISPVQALPHLPRMEVEPTEASLLEAGRFLPLPDSGEIQGPFPKEGDPLVVTIGDRLVAMVVRDANRLRPRKVFPLDG